MSGLSARGPAVPRLVEAAPSSFRQRPSQAACSRSCQARSAGPSLGPSLPYEEFGGTNSAWWMGTDLLLSTVANGRSRFSGLLSCPRGREGEGRRRFCMQGRLQKSHAVVARAWPVGLRRQECPPPMLLRRGGQEVPPAPAAPPGS